MGLFDELSRKFKTEEDFKLLLLGLDNVGKTSIFDQLSREQTSSVCLAPRMGYHTKSFSYKNNKLKAWDVSGQKFVRSYWKSFLGIADALIYVIDGSDRARIEESVYELTSLLNENKLRKVPLLLFVNKQDILFSLNSIDLIQQLNLNHLIENRQWIIQDCSCMSESGIEGIQDGLESLLFVLNHRPKLYI